MKSAIAKLEKDELYRVPLKKRMKILFASLSSSSTDGTKQVLKSSVDTVVKKEDGQCDSQHNPSNISSVLMDGKFSQSAGIVKGLPCPTQMKRNHSCELHKKWIVSSPLLNSVHVKAESVDNNMVETTMKNEMGSLPVSNMVLVKSKLGITYEFTEDELDNMVLSERMKLYSSRTVHSFKVGRIVDCQSEMVSLVPDCTPISSAPTKPLKVCPDSIQTAMEEDAPGLLKLLLQKGVSVNELKLYGKNESDEPLDDLSFEGSFSELQAVISKVFSSQRSSLLKLAPLQCTKGEKASYCLACLFSLIDGPLNGAGAEISSFIFVFERHNRIVLERPEYGYSTYFFELVDSAPIAWQIRRLVIAMKLASCSRVTLIENRTLTVGKDLSEGEARVLKSYGWVPNTGLGTMLNYCDRVYHDRFMEKESSEWKSKIGKLLMAGINGGSIVERHVEDNVAPSFPEIKLEVE
ncbi:unnamed protein product [Withania somnifera]